MCNEFIKVKMTFSWRSSDEKWEFLMSWTLSIGRDGSELCAMAARGQEVHNWAKKAGDLD